MKKKLNIIMLSLIVFVLQAQVIEQLGIIDSIYAKSGFAGGPGSPNEIYYDEVKERITIKYGAVMLKQLS